MALLCSAASARALEICPAYPRLRCITEGDSGLLERLFKRTQWRATTSEGEERKVAKEIRKLRKSKKDAFRPELRRAMRQKLSTLRVRRTWIRDCVEGRLNDGDGEDSPDAPTPPDGHFPVIHECNDGIDNDGDSWSDAADSDCSVGQRENRIARTLCEDGIDNDGDGHIDSADAGCDADSDSSEQGNSGQCSDGVDNDGDGIADYPLDRGCSSPAAAESAADDLIPDVSVTMGRGRWLEGSQFQLREAPGVIESIHWNDPSDGSTGAREVIGYFEDRGLDIMAGNPTRFFLHSSIRVIDESGGQGWRFGTSAQSLGSAVPHSHIQYSELSDRVIEATDGQNLRVRSSVVAAKESVLIQSTVTNLSSEERFYELPLNIPYVLFPEHEGTVRLRGEAGGAISRDFSQNTSWEYPGVNAYAPVVALWREATEFDPLFTVGIAVVSPIQRPDGVTFEEQNRRVELTFLLKLPPGGSKDVAVAIGVAASGEWSKALADYRRFFQYHHSVVPQYCPPGAMVTASGTNTAQYDHTNKRFYPGTEMRDLFPPERVATMSGWYQFAGFWETAIDSTYASPTRPVQKESWVHLFDPNIGFGVDQTLEGFLSHFQAAEVETLWFTRPNFGLEGYAAESDGRGGHLFTPGRVLDLDYTYASDRDTYLSYLEPLAAAGVTAFYVDAFDAPGGAAFVHHVARELEARHGRKITMIVEGVRDVYAGISAQIPVISDADFDSPDPRFGVLVPWLTPYATLYGGRINATLSADHTEEFVMQSIQHQPIPLAGFPNTASKEFCEWTNVAHQNRVALYQSYGANLLRDGVPYCAPPSAPPLPMSRCHELPSFTGW